MHGYALTYSFTRSQLKRIVDLHNLAYDNEKAVKESEGQFISNEEVTSLRSRSQKSKQQYLYTLVCPLVRASGLLRKQENMAVDHVSRFSPGLRNLDVLMAAPFHIRENIFCRNS